PPPFDLLLPANEATHVLLPAAFRWNPLEDAQSYTLTIAEDADFSEEVYEENVGLGTEAVLDVLNHNSTYDWKVSADATAGNIDSLNTYTFTAESERSLLWTEDFEAYAPGTAPSFLSVHVPKGSTVLVSEEQSS